MAETTVKSEIIKELLEQFPEAGSLTIAKIAYRDNPEVYDSVEQARNTVRRLRGNLGNKERRTLADRRFVRENQTPGEAFGDLPEPVDDLGDTEPIAIEGDRILILSDIHFPYHDREALQAALRFGQEESVDTIILNGDIIDFFSVSRWETDPRRRNLTREIEQTRDFLSILRREFDGAEIHYKLGNHEERWERYLYARAPEVAGVPDFQMEKILRLEDHEIRCATRMQHYQIGKLNVLHGHELRAAGPPYNPVNPARGLFLRAGAIALCGHYHQTSEHTQPDMNENQISCWSTGCLCDRRPEYARYNKWNAGAALVTNARGKFSVRNFKIIDGEIV